MLDKLSQVQLRDLDLDTLQEEKGRTPEDLIAARERKEALQARLAQTEARFSEVRQEVNRNEMEIKTLNERREGAANAAIAAGPTREAAQYQNQELQFATRAQELEDDTLPLMEHMEGLEGEIAELKASLAELDPQLSELAQAEEVRVAGVEEKISTLTGERDAAAEGIDASLLKQYEQVRRAKRGVGVVPIVDNQRCGGCSMRLPIHVIQKAKTGKKITRCPSCGRILWAKDGA